MGGSCRDGGRSGRLGRRQLLWGSGHVGMRMRSNKTQADAIGIQACSRRSSGSGRSHR